MQNTDAEITAWVFAQRWVWGRQGITESTRATCLRRAKLYLTALRGVPLHHITKQVVEGLIADLKERGLSKGTVAAVLGLLTQILRGAASEGRIKVESWWCTLSAPEMLEGIEDAPPSSGMIEAVAGLLTQIPREAVDTSAVRQRIFDSAEVGE